MNAYGIQSRAHDALAVARERFAAAREAGQELDRAASDLRFAALEAHADDAPGLVASAKELGALARRLIDAALAGEQLGRTMSGIEATEQWSRDRRSGLKRE